MNATHTIPPTAVAEERKRWGSVEILDVRTPVEFQAVHAASARNIPLDELDPSELLKGRGENARPLYLICRSGKRAKQAAERLEKAGLQDVIVIEGGTDAWIAQGLPVVRGKESVSLERQVRIVAGSLILVGSALAYFVSPYVLALPALIGGGLLFSGLTDTCGMGMVLAKMPWNQVKRDCEAACPR